MAEPTTPRAALASGVSTLLSVGTSCALSAQSVSYRALVKLARLTGPLAHQAAQTQTLLESHGGEGPNGVLEVPRCLVDRNNKQTPYGGIGCSDYERHNALRTREIGTREIKFCEAPSVER